MTEESAAVTTEAAPAATEVTTTEAPPTPQSEAAPAETTPAESAPSGEDSPEKPHRKPGAENRIRDLNRKWREEQRRAEDAESRLQALQNQQNGQDETVFPQLEDFDYDVPRFNQAVAEYNSKAQDQAIQRGIAERERVEAALAQQRANAAAVEMFVARAEDFAQDNDGFNATSVLQDTRISIPVRQALVLSENGPAMAHYLASNPEVAAQISSLPPMLAGMQMGQIQQRLATPPTPITTETPAPTPPVGASGVPGPDPSSETMEQYVARRNKERGRG